MTSMRDILLTVFLSVICCSKAQAIFDWTLIASESLVGEHHDLFEHKLSRNRRSATIIEVPRLEIETKVTTRFAVTSVDTDLRNPTNDNVATVFQVQVPQTAFISGFRMLINDVWQNATVKSREEANREYEEAVSQNRTAGKIDADTPPTATAPAYELFSVHVSVRSNSGVRVVLEYQELLQRRFGLYELRLSIRPQHVVENLSAKIWIYDSQGIKNLTVSEPVTAMIDRTYAQIAALDQTLQQVTYQPPPTVQMMDNDHRGLSDDLIIQYDVINRDDIGNFILVDEYFVHFYSPNEENLQPQTKNLIFVIDVSGSMGGTKIRQTAQAMWVILNRLETSDQYAILLFDDDILAWPSDAENRQEISRLVLATEEWKSRSFEFLDDKLMADGATDIHLALKTACDAASTIEGALLGQTMIVFLTDGNPTSGIRAHSEIIDKVERACGPPGAAIFSLGFGDDVDLDLLRGLSFRTGGTAHRIYADMHAAEQLTDFFRSISRPLLYDVRLNYPEVSSHTSAMTTHNFAQFFSGSELVVAGKLTSDVELPDTLSVSINAMTSSGGYSISGQVSGRVVIPPIAQDAVTESFLEKLYVQLRIVDLLKKRLLENNEDRKKELEDEALELALEYQLVTPLTSIIIVEQDRVNSNKDVSHSIVPYGPHMADGSVSASLWSSSPFLVLLNCVNIFRLFA